jgi:predicted RNase H-like HicB family nuclease
MGKRVRYTVVIEKGPESYGAYVPDLPGCAAVGDSVAQVKRLIREAIELHIEGMIEDGEQPPAASARSAIVETEIPA